MYNALDGIKIICWGELICKNRIQKLIPNIIEGQKEEWLSAQQFYNTKIKEQDENVKYLLLIDDKTELIDPQEYFFKIISVFLNNPIVSFVYCDYNKILLPSFKPNLFNNIPNNHNIPIFYKNKKSPILIEDIDNYYLSHYVRALSSSSVGYHIAEPLIRIYK